MANIDKAVLCCQVCLHPYVDILMSRVRASYSVSSYAYYHDNSRPVGGVNSISSAYVVGYMKSHHFLLTSPPENVIYAINSDTALNKRRRNVDDADIWCRQLSELKTFDLIWFTFGRRAVQWTLGSEITSSARVISDTLIVHVTFLLTYLPSWYEAINIHVYAINSW